MCTVRLIRKLVFIIFDAVLVKVVFERKLDRFLCQDGAVELVCGKSVKRLGDCFICQSGCPFISSVAIELEAIALPQPKVSNFTSVMMSLSIFR